MRLSEWRASSPSREAVSTKVNTIVDPVLAALGAETDPSVWVAWGEEPGTRYTILVPTPAGLISCFVRTNVPGEGPRAAAKLARWNRIQLGELAIETQGGHRIGSFQVEQLVLRGADEVADLIGRFATELFAAIDGRVLPAAPPAARSRTRPAASQGPSPRKSAAKTTKAGGTRRTASGTRSSPARG